MMSLWPQFTWIAVGLVGLFMSIVDDGKLKTKRESAIITLIAYALVNGVLYAGGFFDGLLR